LRRLFVGGQGEDGSGRPFVEDGLWRESESNDAVRQVAYFE